MVNNLKYSNEACINYFNNCAILGKSELKIILEIQTISDSIDFCKKQSLYYKDYNDELVILYKILLKKINKICLI